MNWMIRLGQWMENRRCARQTDMVKLQEQLKAPPSLIELNRIKIRLDQLELYVGLKREPVATVVPGAPRIS